MTREDFIKRLEELDTLLLEEVDLKLTDYARYQVHVNIESTVEVIKENEYRQYY